MPDTDQVDAQPEHREPIMEWFEYGHLPEHLQGMSKLFADVAETLHAELPRSAERAAGLRKLMEAKDCAVRCAVSDAR